MCRCPCRSLGGGSLHALQPLVSHRARLSDRLSGLICRTTRFRAAQVSGLVAGLVGSRRGWSCIGAGCRACWFALGLVADRGFRSGLVAAPGGELVLNIPLVQLGLQASPNCTPARGTNGIFSIIRSLVGAVQSPAGVSRSGLGIAFWAGFAAPGFRRSFFRSLSRSILSPPRHPPPVPISPSFVRWAIVRARAPRF